MAKSLIVLLVIAGLVAIGVFVKLAMPEYVQVSVIDLRPCDSWGCGGWSTLIQEPNGVRHSLCGNYGKPGEVFTWQKN